MIRSKVVLARRRQLKLKKMNQPPALPKRPEKKRGGKKQGRVMITPRVEAVVARAAPSRIHVLSALERSLLLDLNSAVAAEVLPTDSSPIAVLVPVLSRPQNVAKLVASFRAATSPKDAVLYFVAQASDTAEVEAIRRAGFEPILVGDADRSWAKKINRGFEQTTEPWLLLGADDLSFRPGWVDVVRKLLRVHRGVIGTNDLGNGSTIRGTSSTHPLVRRKYAEICGTIDERNKIVHEGYDHNFPDTELSLTAKQRGVYIHCVRCIIEHMHPAWGKSSSDAVYLRGQSNFKQDSALFSVRAHQYRWI